MKLLSELLTLSEAGLQAELKSGFKPAGTLAEVGGEDAEAVAHALEGKPTEKAYVFVATTPSQKAAAKGLIASARRMSDGFDVARLAGGRKVVVISGRIYTSQYQLDSMVS